MAKGNGMRLVEGGKPTRIAVIGTGFVGRHFTMELLRRPKEYSLGRVLTRRRPSEVTDFPAPAALTDSLDAVIDSADIVLECSGDVRFATQTIDRVMAAGKPVVTLGPEFHVTTGSAFVGRGLLTEGEGDQPGSQASLHEEAISYGFEPLVYGNIKGFLNRHPTPEDMAFWAGKQGISVPMVTSFTDGTKLQVEQCLVGNYFGTDIAKEELLGPEGDDLRELGKQLGEAALAHGRPIVDYVVSRKLPHGVFVVAKHDEKQRDALRYLKMGDGPIYTLLRSQIYVHLEVFRTIERVVRGGGILLDNSADPKLSVASVAKRDLLPGERIERGCGSFDLRGICVRIAEHPKHLPIGLAEDLVVKRKVEAGQFVDMDDVELPESLALTLWGRIAERATARPRNRGAA